MKPKAKHLLAAAVAALAVTVPPALGAAAVIDLTSLPGPIRTWPFKQCDRARHSFIIDAEATGMCGGNGVLSGPGWWWRAWPGLVNGGQHYMTVNDAPAPPDETTKSEFFPTITVPGLYDVWVSWRATHNRASQAPYYVYADDGNAYRGVVDQRGDEGFRAIRLGRFFFNVHRRDRSLVTLVNSEGDHSKGSDAVFIRYACPTDVRNARATRGTYPDKIVVRWGAVPGVRAYRVYRSRTLSLANAELVATISDPPREVYVDTGLARGDRFDYWVRAIGILNRPSQRLSNRASGYTTPPAP